MISELIQRLKKLVKEAAAALKAQCRAAAHLFNHSVVPDNNVIVASEGNVLDTGKRYRKTSGHSPLFSLYTFFANR
jgi:hypothetical protein